MHVAQAIAQLPDQASLTSRQRRMLEFALVWYALGGGSAEEINERFGISDREFFAEVDRLMAVSPPALNPTQFERMRTVVRRRIWLSGR